MKNSIKNYTIIIFMTLIVIIASVFLWYILSEKKNSQIASECPVEYLEEDFDTISEEFINLPENIFDAEERIHNTTVTVKYPSKGFYDLGVKIYRESNGIGILTENGRTGMGVNMNLSVGVEPIEKDTNLNTVVDEFRNNVKNYEEAYTAVGRGNVVSINNNTFFVYKVIQYNISWHAIAINEDEKISITLIGPDALGFVGDLNERVIQEDMDILFLEILENIRFE